MADRKAGATEFYHEHPRVTDEHQPGWSIEPATDL